MARDIKLSGGEITILKAVGFGGTQLYGKLLLDRLGEDIIAAEFLDTLEGLMSMGYVLSNKVNVRTMDDVQRAFFRVNPVHARDLKDATNPSAGRERQRERRARRA
jgi:hypothetical protein